MCVVCVYIYIYIRKEGRQDKGRKEGTINRRKEGRKDARMDGRKDERTEGRADEQKTHTHTHANIRREGYEKEGRI